MAQIVGDFVWQRLHRWGVHRIFGHPGDGINGLLGVQDRAGRPDHDFEHEGRITGGGMKRSQASAVVVTGASAGVGRAVWCEFARDKARIGLIARGRDGLEAAAGTR